MVASVSDALTAAGVSAFLRVNKHPTVVSYSMSGTYSGHVMYVEVSNNVSGGWRRVAGPFTTDDATVTGSVVVDAGEYVRVGVQDVSAIDQVTGTIDVSLTAADELVNEYKDRDGNALLKFFQSGVRFPGTVTVTGDVVGANVNATGTGAGVIAGSSVVATESGNGPVQKTVLTLTDRALAVTDALAYASSKLYDFPVGRVLILGVTASLAWSVTSDRASTINDSAAMDWSLGSVVASATTLASTMADLLPKIDQTLDGVDDAYTEAFGGALAASAQFGGDGAALDMYLNVAFPTTTEIDADGTLAITGTVTIHWINLGDYVAPLA